LPTYLRGDVVDRDGFASRLEWLPHVKVAKVPPDGPPSPVSPSPLAPIYHWISEGFDTADLIEARTLLDAVAHRCPAARRTPSSAVETSGHKFRTIP